ncbi:MAG: hypothetical protein AAFZ15_02285 [Bacteroidota bacterium]
MALNNDDVKLIERYLSGQLSEAEKASFQTRLILDKNLRQELDFMRATQLELISRKMKADASSGKKKHFNYLFIIGAILTISLAGYFLFNNSKQIKSNKNSTPTTNGDRTNPEKKNSPSLLENPKKNNSPTEAPPSQNPNENKKAPAEKKEPSRPIATADPADFKPNDYLENFINRRSNPTADQIKIELPNKNAELKSENGKINFVLKGALSTEKNRTLQLHIFSNRQEAFDNFQPSFSSDLPTLKNAANELVFDFQKNIALQPGLYYFTIETTADGEMLALEKFYVDFIADNG